MRSETIFLAAVLMSSGAAAILISQVQFHSLLVEGIGLALVLLGAFAIAVRPWNFMKRMELQLSAHHEAMRNPSAKRAQYGHADARWHHEGEDGHSPGICESCGMLRDEEGRCRRCDEDEG